MRSLSNLVVALVVCSLVCVSSSAFAGYLFQDNFDGHDLNAALSSVPPTIGDIWIDNSGAVVVADVTTQAAAGAGHAGKFASYTSGSGSNMFGTVTPLAEAESAGQVVTYRLDVYGSSGSSGKILDIAAYANSSYAGNVFDIELKRNGTVTYYNTGDTVLQTATGTFTAGTWVPVTVVADYTAKTYSVNVGGVTFSDVFNTAATNTVGALYLSTPLVGASIDNVSISYGTIPEPSSMLLLGTGLFGLLAYAWRKRR